MRLVDVAFNIKIFFAECLSSYRYLTFVIINIIIINLGGLCLLLIINDMIKSPIYTGVYIIPISILIIFSLGFLGLIGCVIIGIFAAILRISSFGDIKERHVELNQNKVYLILPKDKSALYILANNVTLWLHNNNITKYNITVNNTNIIYCFKDRTDAVLFKLYWN